MTSQIKELKDGTKKVNIILKLIAKSEPRYAKGYKITTFTGGDATGTIAIPFWNDEANAVRVGDVIEITNGYVTSFRKRLQLNVGKFGSFHHVESPEGFTVMEASPQGGMEVPGESNPIESLERLSKNLVVTVYVKEMVEERTVNSKRDGKKHRVGIFLVGDATGSILLNLWDDWIDMVEVGSTITIQGAFVRAFQGQRFLNLHKYAKVVPSEWDVEFNATNNLSEKVIVDFSR